MGEEVIYKVVEEKTDGDIIHDSIGSTDDPEMPDYVAIKAVGHDYFQQLLLKVPFDEALSRARQFAKAARPGYELVPRGKLLELQSKMMVLRREHMSESANKAEIKKLEARCKELRARNELLNVELQQLKGSNNV